MRKQCNISHSELHVLRVLWEQDNQVLRDIIQALRKDGLTRAHTTVQTHLARLEAKGYVKCDSSRRAYTYRAACSQEEFAAQGLHNLADEICKRPLTRESMWLMVNLPFSHVDIARFCELHE